MKIIKYGAKWCGPCRATSDILKDSGYEFTEIDVDDEKNDELIKEKNIRSIPVIEFYSNDSNYPEHVHTGLLTKIELDNIINKFFKNEQ